ncbi:hypothetical protein EDC01DRAFT_730111 [Geopyxis carbonaria]|nr:hypothetical protein EDC01DRAFT_730111 [Geopyxis carbonaria]
MHDAPYSIRCTTLRTPNSPRLIVGIDIGLTSTGVAYRDNWAPEPPEPHVVRNWPGLPEFRFRHKVPTAVAIDVNDPQISFDSVWGYNCWPPSTQDCPPNKPWLPAGSTIQEYFKLHLDDKVRKDTFADKEPTVEHIQNLYAQFVKRLYLHLEKIWKEEWTARWQDRWESVHIDYHFSVPTTWTDEVVHRFEQALEKSGIADDRDGPTRTWEVGLTESEAAAVSIARDQRVMDHILKEGDTILVCDAGGGTTDTAGIIIKSKTEDGQVKLEQPIYSMGESIGAVQIDLEFETLVKSRLYSIRDAAPISPNAAQIMRKGQFQGIKHSFGDTAVAGLGYRIAVPGLPNNFQDAEADIEGGEMIFRLDELENLFEKQTIKLTKLLDKQLQALFNIVPNNPVSALFLCGGFGSSEYVKKYITKYYEEKRRYGAYTNASKMEVVTLPGEGEGQVQSFAVSFLTKKIVVCKGLVTNIFQTKNLADSAPVLTHRRCRVSYGILCNVPYDKKKHHLQPIRKDPTNSKTYAIDQIFWFALKNSVVNVDEVKRHRLQRICKAKDPCKTWEDVLVVSTEEDTKKLPTHLPVGKSDPSTLTRLSTVTSDLGITNIAKMEADPDTNEVRREARWFGIDYLKFTYEILPTVKPASLALGIWFNNKECNKNKEFSIKPGLGAPLERIAEAQDENAWRKRPILILDSKTKSKKSRGLFRRRKRNNEM